MNPYILEDIADEASDTGTDAHGGVDDKMAGDAIARGEENVTAEKPEGGTDSGTAFA